MKELLRKAKSCYKLASGGHYDILASQIPPLKFLLTATNLIPPPC